MEAADEPSAATILPGPGRPGTARTMVSMSGRGKFGRYLKRATTFPDYLHALTSADAQAVIEDLLRVLAGKERGCSAGRRRRAAARGGRATGCGRP